MELFTFVFLILLALTFPLAHLIGWLTSSSAEIEDGHIREAMPSLPASPPLEGRAEQRWDKRISKVEKTLLERFSGGAEGVEAHELAAQLGEEPIILEAVLAHMREEIPCRMRITQSGRIIHDFTAQDIAELKRLRRRSVPKQILLSALAAMANIGAAWPFLSLILIVGFALFNMASAPPEQTLSVGINGIISASLVIVVTLVGGFVAQLLFTPLFGPRLGDVKKSEPVPARALHANHRPHARSAAQDILFWSWVHNSSSYNNSYHHTGGGGWAGGWGPSWGRGRDSSSSDDGGLDLEDAGQGILIVIVVVVLLAILAAAVSVVWLWLRGIWRALNRLEEPHQGISPTLWVRTADVIDKWERFIPTNDLVVRTLHALKRYFAHRRPADDDMAARVMVLAKSRGGVVSALELALHEGLDMNESNEVGSRLCGMLGGKIMVSELGELAFAFPQHLLQNVVATPDQDMFAEYVVFDPQGRVMRRANQEQRALPVNIVGLTKGHLSANDRLVAGTYLMATMGIFFMATMLQGAWLVAAPLALLLVGMALGTASLNATARYTSRLAASQGVRRDVRRAAFKRIQLAMKARAQSVDLRGLDQQLLTLFASAYSRLDLSTVQREIRAVCVDLELEPDTSVEHAGEEVYDLTSLRERLSSVENISAVFEDEEVAFDFDPSTEADEVVFDTQITHNHIASVGRAS